jgi:hypothetical protein
VRTDDAGEVPEEYATSELDRYVVEGEQGST